MPTAIPDPVFILKGKVADLAPYAAENASRLNTGRALIAIGDDEWTFADSAPAPLVARAAYIDLIEGLRAFSGRTLVWAKTNDAAPEPAPEPERRTYKVTLYAKRFLYRTVTIHDAVSARQAVETAAAMPDDDLTAADWTEMDEIASEPIDTADVELVENNA